jgi:hypothetical protein
VTFKVGDTVYWGEAGGVFQGVVLDVTRHPLDHSTQARVTQVQVIDHLGPGSPGRYTEVFIPTINLHDTELGALYQARWLLRQRIEYLTGRIAHMEGA